MVFGDQANKQMDVSLIPSVTKWSLQPGHWQRSRFTGTSFCCTVLEQGHWLKLFEASLIYRILR